MAGHSIIALLSWVFLAAGILFQFFVILSGAVSGNPEPHFWFLGADTSGIPNAPANSAWTFFSLCQLDSLSGNAKTFACGKAQAAFPLNPPGNFNTVMNIPMAFLGSHYYYYLSRFAVAFFYIAIFFSGVSLFVGLLALCTRLGSYLSGLTVALAFFFQALSTSLMTAWVVKGRNAFRADGRSAVVGRYSMGFSWGIVVAFLLAMIMFCVAPSASKSKGNKTPKKSRFGAFGRKRSTRSRGSFYGSGSDSGGRVKEDYA